MARQMQYILRRGNGLFFRIAVPAELRNAVGSRELVRSLETQCRHEAAPQALELAAAAKRLFYELRREPMAVDLEKLKLVTLKKKLQIRESDHRQELDAQAAKHAAELKQLRIESDRSRLEAENKALREAVARAVPSRESEGEDVPATASAARVRSKGGKHKLADTLDHWKRLKSPSPATIEIYETEVRRFDAQFPGLRVGDIERRHIREHIEAMQVSGLSSKSIEKAHGAIRALLNIARDREWLTGNNPAAGVMLPANKGGPAIRGYTAQELQRVFASPVFTLGLRPKAGKGEAAFWLPLLMLWTGARREELAQLTTDRVVTREGVACILIDTIDDEGRLKTAASKRTVPVHAELERAGFLSFVKICRQSGQSQLFSVLKPNKRGQYGAKWGDWWSRYVRVAVGISDERVSPAHSFRHAFITECRRLPMREDYERALVGHVRGGSGKDAHDSYGEIPIESLAAELNRISYRGLDLSSLSAGDSNDAGAQGPNRKAHTGRRK